MGAPIRKVAWLHIEGRRLLCVRTAGLGPFYVPGGKPEAGEDDVAALLRETAEELGIVLSASTIRPAGRFSAPADGKPGQTVVIEAYFADHLGALSPGAEIAEYRFLASTEGEATSAATRQILQHLKAANAID